MSSGDKFIELGAAVEKILNELREAEAEKLAQVSRYARDEQQRGYYSSHYSRNLTTTFEDIRFEVPKLKGIFFETTIIERYRCRQSRVKELLLETYLTGVSVRCVENITEALWELCGITKCLSPLSER